MPLTWNDCLSVGIPEIDLQHQCLVSMINELHDALKKEHSRDLLLKRVEQLIVQTQEHFDTEEHWLHIHSYPEAESHRQCHQELLKRITDFMDDVESGNHGVDIKFCLFLSDWLEIHLKEEDQRYSRYFKDQDIT
ncbi:bacteriohemerythrin [Planctomycetota bacterium]